MKRANILTLFWSDLGVSYFFWGLDYDLPVVGNFGPLAEIFKQNEKLIGCLILYHLW